MRLVFLDAHTIDPNGDLSWAPLRECGAEPTLYPRTSPEELIEHAEGAELLITNKVRLDAKSLRALSQLKYVGVIATGFDVVNVGVARELGITVTNVPSYGTNAVAQHTFALLLELTNRVQDHATTVRNGEWSRSSDWCYWRWTLNELAGKTIGIVGYGRIGQKLGEIAIAFDMKVQFHDGLIEGDGRVPLEQLFQTSDVVSLHCPLTPDTAKMINRSTLSLMKSTAILLNTSRGGLVNDEDLARALNESRIGGAGLDVLPQEPPSEDQPLLQAKNCIITPHVAWAARESRQRLLGLTAANIAAYLAGKPTNVVN
jgi:glycerate dehydrogenase